jgi:hypothetical protein
MRKPDHKYAVVFYLSIFFTFIATRAYAEDCLGMISNLYKEAKYQPTLGYNLTVNTSGQDIVTYSSGPIYPEVISGKKIIVARNRDLLYSNRTYPRSGYGFASWSQPFDIEQPGNITLSLHAEDSKIVSLRYNHYNQSVKVTSIKCQNRMLSGFVTSPNGYVSLLTLTFKQLLPPPK